MNSRGFFITFMVFLLVASVLALHETSKKIDFGQERNYIDEAAFNNVNNAFNNIYEEVVSLNKEGYASIVQQRTMPFAYDLNSGRNAIILSQRIPVRPSILDSYIDALNIYRIFVNSEETTGVDIDANSMKNASWGGGEQYPDLNYVILPQCLVYDVNAGNYMMLRELGAGNLGCISGFSYADLNVIDVNIGINSGPCTAGSISGNLELLQGDFDPHETNPFFRITINETNPSGYPLTGTGKREIYGHFDPESYLIEESIDWLKIVCNTNDWVRIKLGRESENDVFPFVAQNFIPAQPVNIDLNLTFDGKVDLFYFTGFTVSVEKANFPVKRST